MVIFIYFSILLGGIIILNINIININNYILLVFNYLLLILPVPIIIFFISNLNIINYKLKQIIKLLLLTVSNTKNLLYDNITYIIKKILLTYLFIIDLLKNIIKSIYNLPIIIMLLTIYTLFRLCYMILSFYIPYLIFFIINYIYPNIQLLILNFINLILYYLNSFTLLEQLLDYSNYYDYYLINSNIYNLNFFNDLFSYISNLFLNIYLLLKFYIQYLDFSEYICNINIKNISLNYLIKYIENLFTIFSNLNFYVYNYNYLYNFEYISNINNFMENNNNNILYNINNFMDKENKENDLIQSNSGDNNNLMDIETESNILNNNNLDLNTIFNLVNSNIIIINEDITNFNNDSSNFISDFRFRVSRYVVNFQITNLGSNFKNNPFNLDNSNERFSLLNNTNFRSNTNFRLNPLNILTPVYFNNNNIINLDTYSVESQINYYRNILIHNNLQNFFSISLDNSANISNISNISDVISNDITNVTNVTNINDISETTSISNTDITTNFSNSDITDNTNITNNFNNSYNIDRGEGSSNLNQSNNKNAIELPSFMQDIEIDALIAANYEFCFGEDTNMAEIFTVAGGTNSNYFGGVDVYGNIHLSADILDDPAFEIVAKLVPGVDFIEGFDSFVIYDHDSVFFKNMIQNAFYYNTHEILLDYLDSSRDTWYNFENRKLVREILYDIILEKNSLNLDTPEIKDLTENISDIPDSEMKDLDSETENTNITTKSDKGKGRLL
uniref:Uncharacterized protein n=1 Tax=Paxillus involutus TaxID=71150 RepID=A0A5Q0N4R1_PAXIN|nr:hypothetical protein [Paxillus involutus]QFZ98777.1 hypothetical protein [Paxillus involutus]